MRYIAAKDTFEEWTDYWVSSKSHKIDIRVGYSTDGREYGWINYTGDGTYYRERDIPFKTRKAILWAIKEGKLK